MLCRQSSARLPYSVPTHLLARDTMTGMRTFETAVSTRQGTTIELDDLGHVPGWMLLPPGASQADLDSASPIALLDEDFPPTIIFHGTADRTISPRSSIALHERLSELGVPSDLHLYAGRDHEFDMAPSMTAATVAAATSFLERTVVDAAESEAEARRYPFPPSAR